MEHNRNRNYDDMIHLPHHTSAKRPRMPRANRAAQFSPFAALTGYDAAIREAGRITQQEQELSEECQAVLDRKQHFLLERLAQHPEIAVTCFLPDPRKTGGSYVTLTGRLKGVDNHRRVMIMEDKTEIPLDRITALEGRCFDAWYRLEEASQP